MLFASLTARAYDRMGACHFYRVLGGGDWLFAMVVFRNCWILGWPMRGEGQTSHDSPGGCDLAAIIPWGGSLVAQAIRNAIRANRFARIIRNWHPYFYSASGRFARITRISDSRESPDSRESCESIRANHATKGGRGLKGSFFLVSIHGPVSGASFDKERRPMFDGCSTLFGDFPDLMGFGGGSCNF